MTVYHAGDDWEVPRYLVVCCCNTNSRRHDHECQLDRLAYGLAVVVVLAAATCKGHWHIQQPHFLISVFHSLT